jgi:hypothetical protein
VRRLALVAVLLSLSVGWRDVALPQVGGTGPARPAAAPDAPRPAPHRTGELDCANCHLGKHQGVVRMYLGLGGRGTPMIPSHMFQVRVECAACHVAPKEEEAWAGIVGQTFRPSETACLTCHGERYRAMLGRWVGTLDRMQDILAPKLAAARAAVARADPKDPRHGRARQLFDDAEFNSRFVAFGKGVHNVFYAADLLKLANGWLDEAVRLVGQPAVALDDALVRGGYCAVLCHEQAGVKLLPTVRFENRPVPHVRHVSEFGAVCTACHSAEVHRAVTATPQTCAACHHGPQNERCESCHRAQAAFYRGRVTTTLAPVEPNVMADAVSCTGCHDLAGPRPRQAVGPKCVGCHDAPYVALLSEWTGGFDQDAARAVTALKRADAALGAARRAGRSTKEAEMSLTEARSAVALVRRARGAHNPGMADALLEGARRTAEDVLARLGRVSGR